MAEINWKYNIGDRIVDHNQDGALHRDLTVVDRKIVESGKYKYKYYQCRCNICNQISQWIRENGLSSYKQGCIACKYLVWKYSIGDHIVKKSEDGTTIIDFVITNRDLRIKKSKSSSSRKGYDNRHMRYYEYKCNICGAENLWKHEKDVERQRCGCCTNQVRVKGINTIGDIYPHILPYLNKEDAFSPSLSSNGTCIAHCPNCGFEKQVSITNLIFGGFHCDHCCSFATQRPYLIKYLVSKQDANLSAHSGSNVLTKCPDCGHEKYMQLNYLSNWGYNCPRCGDGLSFAEKFVISVLTQLGVDFTHQLSKRRFSWCDKYRYDFYIPGKSMIIETHGIQHYEDTFNSYGGFTAVQEQANDKAKEELAKSNNIVNYITLDCRFPNEEWIRDKILSSPLNKIYDFSSIDWQECAKFALKNRIKDICDYWNSHSDITLTELSELFNLGTKSLRKYLKLGTQFGWCNYKTHKRATMIFLNGRHIKTIDSIANAAKWVSEKYHVHISDSDIYNACTRKNGECNGFVFRLDER